MAARCITLRIIAVCWALGAAPTLCAQNADSDEGRDAPTPAGDDEVVVRGQTLGTIRAEIRDAVDDVL